MIIDIFYVLLGIVSALAAVYYAKGKNRMLVAGVIGAVVGIVFAILRMVF
ncbi:MAG: hypothetical protein AAF198_02475 [Pseudomonadota bacterium]